MLDLLMDNGTQHANAKKEEEEIEFETILCWKMEERRLKID